ncbi:MAG: alpha/beta fold hydrolase [Clostridiaceae bacterium]
MGYRKQLKSYRSADKKTEVICYIYEPEIPPVAILQISHGMCEYIERYEDFIGFLSIQGILVCGNDHLGHGKSLSEPTGLGYFSRQDGDSHLVEDLQSLKVLMGSLYPRLPYFMLGHSMGSFVLRKYLSLYGEELDGAIISGTAGPNPMTLPGQWLSTAMAKFKGDDYRSPFFNRLFFQGFNKPFENEGLPFAWLSRDSKVVEDYAEDSLCNFTFTLNGFSNLLKLMGEVTKPSWSSSVPKDLPLLLLSGTMDPVGNFGSGVEKTYDLLKNQGITNLTLKLYPDGRHEMLNEINREEVYQDINKWLKERILVSE